MKKIAIACQGGGSHTAFTAGVLISLLKQNAHIDNTIVGLSGTSGGAICATLAWTDILKGTKNVGEELEAFWMDNATENMLEWMFNRYMMQWGQFVETGLLPEIKVSPYNVWLQLMQSSMKICLPNFYQFFDLKSLVRDHIDFDELDRLNKQKMKSKKAPVLLIGAADVVTGEYRIFNSRKDKIEPEHLLASAAVPTIFKTVKLKDGSYWDGLFSDNPPVDELVHFEHVGKDNIPDELWIIQINPKTCSKIPKTCQQIEDRRNEMEGNISLSQDLKHVQMINHWIEKEAFTKQYMKDNNLRYIKISIITMSDEFLSKNENKLRCTSKLNRDDEFIRELIEHGKERGADFMKNRMS